MTTNETSAELRHYDIDAGPARVAVFRRRYDAPVDDVWDACTNPDRLRRWYVPVTGELRPGGTFQQAMMGSGVVAACEPPHRLRLVLGGGADEIRLSLTTTADGSTDLELQHATTLDTHRIGGELFDAVFCTGGGYYPRLAALDRLLRGTLPDDYHGLDAHERADTQEAIRLGSTTMAALLAADG